MNFPHVQQGGSVGVTVGVVVGVVVALVLAIAFFVHRGRNDPGSKARTSRSTGVGAAGTNGKNGKSDNSDKHGVVIPVRPGVVAHNVVINAAFNASALDHDASDPNSMETYSGLDADETYVRILKRLFPHALRQRRNVHRRGKDLPTCVLGRH